jgi:hypothetical protein
MHEIKCLENYKHLREMFSKGEKGNARYFSEKVGISTRSFFRLISYLREIDNMEICYDKENKTYYLE